MAADIKRFAQDLPAFTSSVLDVLLPAGFSPILVGGVVRDYLLTGKVGKDWDIELTHQSLSWDQSAWKELGRTLGKQGRVAFLPYDVIRLEMNGTTMEFSPPRIETFTVEQSHKNFTVQFDYKLPFEEAVKRRDFTLNSLGYRILSKKEGEFLDPLGGLLHMREKILHPSGPDFAKDPVRFLRAVRFLTKYDFQPSPELEKILNKMNVTGFSHTYLWNETVKSGDPVRFYGKLLEWGAIHPNLQLPLIMNEKELEEMRNILIDPTSHEAWMVALEWVGLSAENWARYFSLGAESAKRLSRWAKMTKDFRILTPEKFHGEFEQIRDSEEFKLVFDWYFSTRQILQKNPDLPLLKMIEKFLPDWIHLYRFEPVKDVRHIDPPYRAKYLVWNLCQRL